MNPQALQNLILRAAGLAGNALAQALTPKFDELILEVQATNDLLVEQSDLLDARGAAMPPSPSPRVTGGSPGPKEKDGAVSKLLSGSLLAIFGKITAALAPIAVLGAAIGAQSSGFSVFISAVQVLGTTLGVLLLPLFVIFSAAVLAVSGMLADYLLPRLADYYALVIGSATEAVDIWSAAVATMVQVFGVLEGVVVEVGDTMAAMAEELYAEIVDFVTRFPEAINTALSVLGVPAVFGATKSMRDNPPDIGDGNRERVREFQSIAQSIRKMFDINLQRERDTRGTGDPLAGGDKSFASRFKDGLTETIAQLRHNMGPRAQRMGIAEAGRAAQLAAVQISPFEAKMLLQMDRAIKALEEAMARNRPAIVN